VSVKAARRDPYEGLLEPIVQERPLRQRRWFGCWAYYVDERLVWVNAASRDPWRGVLVPTVHDHHAALRRDVPQLRVHPVLEKWLYLPARCPEFEAAADRLAALVARGDERIGVTTEARRRARPRAIRKERVA
jgi:hypothetical protein